MRDGVRVRLLGPFEVEGIDLGVVPSRKARTLAKVLALAGDQPVAVDRLIDILWGDTPPRRPEREVAVHASRLRGVLGPEHLERSDAGYRLRVAWSDVDELGVLAGEARRRLAAHDPAGARAAATAALALIRGPLLADEPDPWWAEAERAGAAREVAEVRRAAAQAALVAGDLDEAAVLAEGALDHDPYDEAALRILMRAQAAAARPGSALAAYADLRGRLADELGVSPSAETEALHTAILRDEPSVPPASGDAADPVREAPRLIGRQREMGTLADALMRAASAAELVVVEGEPGAGKTRLLDAFAASVDVPVLVGRCDELGRPLPLQPVADALAAHVHAVGRSAAADLLGDERPLIEPLIGSTVTAAAVHAGGVPAATATEESVEAIVFAAVAAVLGRVGRPVVLVIDDLHLAGDSTIAWLRFLARRRELYPVLVIAARRAGLGAEVPATETVTLGPLDLDAARQLVGDDDRAADLLERSGGNPLLLTELAAVEGDVLPDSVRAAVAARLDGLDDDAVATLHSAAVLGAAIDLDLLAAVRGRPPIDVLGDLEEGVRCGVLREQGSRFVFRHDLVLDALSAATSANRRALIHREAAGFLADRVAADPFDLAHHARLCGDAALASAALVDAATLVASRYDLAEAERLLDEAIALAPTAQALLARARVRIARADLDGAEADSLDAIAAGADASGLELRAWIARFRHDMASAIRLGEEGARRADDVTTRASCLLAVAFAHRGNGDLSAGAERLESIQVDEAEAHLGLPGWLGVLRVHQGRATEALDLLEPAVGADIDPVHGFWVEHVLQMAAHAHALVGEAEAALALIDRLAAELQRRGSVARYAGVDDNYRSWILRNLGDPTAQECNDRALERVAMTEARAQSLLDRADLRLRADDLDGARDSIDRAADLWAGGWFQNRWRCEQRAAYLRAALWLRTGEPAKAMDEAEVLEAEAGGRGDDRYAVLARLRRAEVRAAMGEAVPTDAVAHDLARLPEVAGLESFWVTADLAEACGVDAWWRLAEERAAAIAGAAGSHADAFRRVATARLTR